MVLWMIFVQNWFDELRRAVFGHRRV